MKIKALRMLVMTGLMNLIPVYKIIDDFQKNKLHDLKGLIDFYRANKKQSPLEIMIMFLFFFIFFLIFSIGYDKSKGKLYYTIFIIRKSVKCSEVKMLNYVDGIGAVIGRNSYGKIIFYVPRIYQKKRVYRFFNEIKKDYPDIIII